MSLVSLNIAVYLFVALLGLAFGSFVNSWIWRVHNNKWRWGGRSICVYCNTPIIWYDNIPLFGFLRLHGLSRCCKKLIPQDYFWVELFSALLFLLIGFYHLSGAVINPIAFFRDLFFASLLLVIFIYDAKYQLILTGVVVGGGLVGFILNYFYLHNLSLSSMLLGGAIGWLFFAVQYYGSSGKWVGGGDVRLGAMLGVWLGWPQILVCIFLAYIFGALVAIPLLILKKKQFGSALPFGTFLAVSALSVILFGNNILNWYLGLMR